MEKIMELVEKIRRRNSYLCAVLEDYLHEAIRWGGSIPAYCETWARTVIAEMFTALEWVSDRSFIYAICIYDEIQRARRLLQKIRKITC